MSISSFQSQVKELKDHRQAHKLLYPLDEILLLTLCAVISGCESFVDIAEYGRTKLPFLRKLSAFKNGTPSHDVLSNIFKLLDPTQFQKIFREWSLDFTQSIQGVVAIDGKTLRGSKQKDGNVVHMISAWADDARMVMGQKASTTKKNEITDIPCLLDVLLLKGAIVTIDAMGCQLAIAEKIIEKEADYLLALKGNQKKLYEDVKLFFEDAESLDNASFYEEIDDDKGRIDTRKYWVCSDIEWLKERHPKWKNLSMIGMVESTRETAGKVTTSTRFYIGSRNMSEQEFGNSVRAHWGIENRLHWVLDVIFRDDDCRVRKDYGAENFTTIKHMAINLLNKAKIKHKHSLRVMRKKSGWDDDFLLSIMKN